MDDSNGENLGFLMEQLLKNGAVDVSFSSIQMKKNRPAVALTIMAKENTVNPLINILFKHSGTLGVRINQEQRIICERKIEIIDTKLGKIKIKVAIWQGNVVNIKPEYEICKAIALNNNVPLKVVQDIAINAYRKKHEMQV
ncbi:nickel insertion protein [Clostridium sp. 'deep sea']|uniref:nickel insertion protein n=1 Tax=Clostridium sp. 'deep sea' TaxID=2779445 RepID=UPI0024342353|nr:nickel insertion protein [Clostridium sp. 'deep sea']